MKYLSSITSKCENKTEKEQLLRLFAPEDKELSNNRAKYSIKEDNLDLIFEVQAHDAVALRALLTSITKTLDIYEKTKKIM